MKKHIYLLIAMMLLLLLTACDSSSTLSEPSSFAETEQVSASDAITDFWQEDEEGEGLNAIFYQGERYYGLVMYDTEIPDNLEFLGITPASCSANVYGRYFTGDAVPADELQTNWTTGGENIYAQYDKNGEIIAFWTEPDKVTGEAAYLGGGITKNPPPYYELPDGET